MEPVQRKLAVTMLVLALVMVSSLTCLAMVSAQTQGNLQSEFLASLTRNVRASAKHRLSQTRNWKPLLTCTLKDMGDKGYFSHTSLDGREFSQRITAAGYKYVAAAENIAKASGVPSASKVYDMWKNSPGHYANMIGNYADAGLGVYTINGYTYYTLDLGKTSSSPTPTPHSTLTATPASTSTPTSTSTPSSTPILPEIPLLVVLSSMILLLTITLAIKLKKRKPPIGMFSFQLCVLIFVRLVLKHGCK
jgi:hypothetical protein